MDDQSPAGRSVPTGLTELHGLTVHGARVWVADPGVRPEPARDYEWIPGEGRAVAIDLEGRVLMELEDPFHRGLASEPWRPTSIAVDIRGDREGFIWVADGYGQNLLHLFSPQGDLVRSIDGNASGAPFSCPHGLLFATMEGEWMLLVADRKNRRIVRLTPEGDVIDVITDPRMRSPSCLAANAHRIVLTELDGALLEIGHDGSIAVVVDRADRVENDEGWPARKGWPNVLIDETLRRPLLREGQLNSPHGVAIDLDGAIYLTEWVIGGRFLTSSTPLQAS